MSSSSASKSNIDLQQLLTYVCYTFSIWNIKQITPKLLKQAKSDKPQVSFQIKILLFKICFLHIFDYQYDLKELDIKYNDWTQQYVQQQIESLILSHLSQVQCPYLLKYKTYAKNNKKQFSQQQQQDIPQQIQNKIIVQKGLNFQSSRSLLICCGWIMAVSNYFNKISQKKLKGIINYQTSFTNNTENNVQVGKVKNCFQEIMKMPSLLDSYSQKYRTITKIYKSINLHKNRIDSLQNKSAKLNQTFREYTKKDVGQIKDGINYSLLTQPLPKELQQQYLFIMSNQMKGMRNRQYFWQWLNSKVVHSQIQYIKDHQLFDGSDTTICNIPQQIVIDRGYINRFYAKSKQFLNRMQNLQQQFNQLLQACKQRQKKQTLERNRNYAKTGNKSKKKEYDKKKIQQDVVLQMKSILQLDSVIQSKNNIKANNLNLEVKYLPSFLGIQLAKHLGIKNPTQKKKTNQNKQNKNVIKPQTRQLLEAEQNIQEIKSKLRRDIQKFTQQIQTIHFS